MEDVDNMDGNFALALDQRTDAFQRRFLLVICGGLAAIGFLASIVYMVVMPDPVTLTAVGIFLASTASGLVLTYIKRQRDAAWALLFGIAAAAGIGLAGSGGGPLASGSMMAMMIAVVMAPFLVSQRGVVILTLTEVALIGIGHAKMGLVDGLPANQIASPAVGTSLVVVAMAALISTFVRHAGQNQELLRQRLMDIDAVVMRARRIATGDLSGTVDRDSEVSDVIASMLDGLRGLVEQIQENASRVASASGEIAAMAQQQEVSAVEQGGAIEETRRTLAAMVEASAQIADSARGVADNAQSTLENAQRITTRIHTLAGHTQRITEILEIIKDVANKSELLALNAALEGTKAGEAGRGFSLVASQMQRLAESVMESVKDVKELTANIREATNATALATEDATRLAGETTDAAQRIRSITEQQSTSTQQVTSAMDDIAEATHQGAAGTNQTLQAVRELSTIADRLNEYVGRFEL